MSERGAAPAHGDIVSAAARLAQARVAFKFTARAPAANFLNREVDAEPIGPIVMHLIEGVEHAERLYRAVAPVAAEPLVAVLFNGEHLVDVPFDRDLAKGDGCEITLTLKAETSGRDQRGEGSAPPPSR